jgi:hypothetical protein
MIAASRGCAGEMHWRGSILRFPITISDIGSYLAALLPGLCIGGLLLGAASAAEGRTETLRWSHRTPPACNGFRVYVGPARGNYTTSIDAGLPARSADGTYSFALEVGDEETVWVAIRAYNSDGLSPFSNAQERSPAPEGSIEALGRPGQPRPTGP